jgi:PAS domain S-box-containing protein
LPYIEGALRGEAQEFERVIPSPTGGPPRHSLANYIPDIVEGVVRGFFVLVTDISEVKRAGLALKESEARFSGIISILADAIISVDEDQQITIFNAGAEKIFGYTRAEVIGRDLGMLLPPRMHDAHRRHVAAFVAGEAMSRPMGAPGMTIAGVRKNGDEFPAEASISKLEAGRKTLLTIALRDITERKRTEMAQQVLAEAGAVLSQSLNYKQTLTTIAELVVHHIGDMCIVDMIEEDARIERLTVAHADPTKAAACEVLAQLSLETGHLLGRSPLETTQALVFDDIDPEILEATVQDDDQRRMLREIAPRSAIVVPLLSADRVLGDLVLASSRPHRYGPHDLGLLTELARRASLAIENARLYAAAQRAARARDDMMGIVAHDVRSPLHAIRLAAQMLERKLAKAGLADGQKNVENILISVGRANRLIEDLLDITRLEAEAMTLSCSALAPLPVVIEGLDAQRLTAAEASLELRIEIAEELPAIWADRHRLLQVLENLIGNAIKFTPEGGRVTIAAAARPGRSCLRSPTRGPAFRRRACPTSSIGSGKPGAPSVTAPGSGCRSARASSRPTAVGSGSRARWIAEPPSSSRSPRPPVASRRITSPRRPRPDRGVRRARSLCDERSGANAGTTWHLPDDAQLRVAGPCSPTAPVGES